MKLSLTEKYSKGFWKGKTVRSVIDANYYKFNAHYNKYPTMYEEDVFEYLIEVSKSLKKVRSDNYLSGKEWRRTMAMPNK